MMPAFHQLTPEHLDTVIGVLAEWEPLDGCGFGLQPGDVGQMFRFGREDTASKLTA